MKAIHYPSATIAKRIATRQAYATEQKNLCKHCNEPLNAEPRPDIVNKPVNTKLFPPGFFDWPIHLHHDHNTGMTIGAVHALCNAVLWQYHGE